MLDGLPMSLPLKNYIKSLKNENSLCLMLSRPVLTITVHTARNPNSEEITPCHQDNQSKESPSSLVALPVAG